MFPDQLLLDVSSALAEAGREPGAEDIAPGPLHGQPRAPGAAPGLPRGLRAARADGRGRGAAAPRGSVWFRACLRQPRSPRAAVPPAGKGMGRAARTGTGMGKGRKIGVGTGMAISVATGTGLGLQPGSGTGMATRIRPGPGLRLEGAGGCLGVWIPQRAERVICFIWRGIKRWAVTPRSRYSPAPAPSFLRGPSRALPRLADGPAGPGRIIGAAAAPGRGDRRCPVPRPCAGGGDGSGPPAGPGQGRRGDGQSPRCPPAGRGAALGLPRRPGVPPRPGGGEDAAPAGIGRRALLPGRSLPRPPLAPLPQLHDRGDPHRPPGRQGGRAGRGAAQVRGAGAALRPALPQSPRYVPGGSPRLGGGWGRQAGEASPARGLQRLWQPGSSEENRNCAYKPRCGALAAVRIPAVPRAAQSSGPKAEERSSSPRSERPLDFGKEGCCCW